MAHNNIEQNGLVAPDFVIIVIALPLVFAVFLGQARL